jgi:hypothetical protein
LWEVGEATEDVEAAGIAEAGGDLVLKASESALKLESNAQFL